MKVLMINTVEFGINGISNVILFLCKILKQNDTQISINIGFFGFIDEYYSKKFEELNIKYIKLPNRREVFKYRKFLRQLYKQKQYNVIHIHGNSSTMILESGIKHEPWQKIITHCHNSKTNHPILNLVLNKLFLKTVDVKLACSSEAGKFLYKSDFEVINNGRFYNEYSFDSTGRKLLREKYNFYNKVVILHVGTFNVQKNQGFLLSCINIMPKRYEFVFIGNYNKKEYSDLVAKLKQHDNVMILGKSTDVRSFYSMADLLVLPSLFEGMPLVLIEAQLNGLACLVSANVSKDCVISDKVNFLPLNYAKWNEFISRVEIDDDHKIEFNKNFDNFDPLHISKRLIEIYS